MTTPQYPEWQSGDPQDPGAWQAPQPGAWQAPQPQYQPPSNPQYQPPSDPQYQPSYDPQYQPPYDPQYQQDPQGGYGEPMPPATPARSRGKLIGASAAVVILAGGGVATYVAFSSADAVGGAANPKAAVEQVVTDLNNSDLAGFLDDLAPGERDAIATPFNDAFHKLQDTKVLSPDANLSNVNGVDVSATGFTYADQTITINDHVQIVQLTGGTLHVSADASKLPFTSEFLQAVAPNGVPADATSDQTVDLGDVVRRTGKPIRIAAQKVDGRWYPSLFYTVADYATADAHTTAPTPAERIPDTGAGSPDDAVRQLIQYLLGGQVQQALALLSPDELGVIHDYGKLIVDRAHYSPAPVTLKDIEFTDTAVSGGTRVVLKSVEVVDPKDPVHHDVVVTNDGSCFTLSAAGQQTKRFCAADLISEIDQRVSDAPLTAEQRTALTDLFSGLSQVAGIVTTQHDGKWFVNPVRSYVGLASSLLSGLKGDDLLILARLFGNH